MRYVLLLRGVNVGGHRRVPMAEFRRVLTELGYADVVTYLQSGNAVATAPGSPDAVAAAVGAALQAELGVTADVLVRTPAELAELCDRLPWPDRAAEPKRLHVAFLSGVPQRAGDWTRFAPDEISVAGPSAYLWYADGAGRSKLTLDVIERGLGVRGTARNWTTVLALTGLASGGELVRAP